MNSNDCNNNVGAEVRQISECQMTSIRNWRIIVIIIIQDLYSAMESEDTEVLKDTKVENIHVGVEALSRTRQTVPELIAVVFQKKMII